MYPTSLIHVYNMHLMSHLGGDRSKQSIFVQSVLLAHVSWMCPVHVYLTRLACGVYNRVKCAAFHCLSVSRNPRVLHLKMKQNCNHFILQDSFFHSTTNYSAVCAQVHVPQFSMTANFLICNSFLYNRICNVKICRKICCATAVSRNVSMFSTKEYAQRGHKCMTLYTFGEIIVLINANRNSSTAKSTLEMLQPSKICIAEIIQTESRQE